MRVTNKMLSNNFLRDMSANLQNLKKLQEQMTSGKEIRRPSDNPFKVARSMQLHTQINANKQYNENIKDTINWLDTTDTALGQAGNVLHRVRELLVSAGNGAYSEEELRAVKDEINEKISEFSQILNTNFDGKYIFGGTRATTKPTRVEGGSNFKGIAQSGALDFSGVKSLTDSSDKLVNPIKLKLSFIDEKKVKIDKEINVSGNIKSLSDLAKQMNTQIQKDANFKDKVEVIPDLSNNKLEIKNIGNKEIEIVDKIDALGIAAGKKIEANNSVNSSVLNLSGGDSLVNEKGELNDNVKIEFNIAGAKPITMSKGETIKSLSDLAGKINDAIQNDPSLKGKITVITDTVNNKLKFINNDLTSEPKGGITITSDGLGMKSPGVTAIYNNNNTNTRLTYNKKGDGELLDGNELDQISQKLKVEISQGVIVDYNVSAREIMEFDGKDLRKMFNDIVNHLDGKNDDGLKGDPDSIKKLINGDLENMGDALNNILKVRSEVGAKQNSMDSAKDKNVDQNFNMKEILSKTEDIDITEKTMDFATAQTVYIASLQTSAKVLQPTLIDYIR